MRRLFPAVFLLLLAAAALIWVQASGTALEYSRFNTGWNGTSHLFAAYDGQYEEVSDPGDLADARNSLLLLIEPAAGFSAEEIAAYQRFLEDGNTILLAGHGPGTAEFLARIGSGIRVSNAGLRSLDTGYPTPAAVTGYPPGAGPLPGNVTRVILNGPHALEGGEPLLVSSVLSWVDENADGRVNSAETMGSAAVFSREQIRSGTIEVLADPGVFINGMAEVNPQFLQALLRERPRLLVEQSRSATAAADGLLPLIILVQHTTIIKIGLLIIALGVIALQYGRKGNHDD
jgi:hypothetical protein